MKIQLALDRLSRDECFRIVNETISSIDLIEIGTGVIKEYGMDIIRQMRGKNPEATILADMKTCDAGQFEAEQAFNAGADIITVMSFASDQTIREMLDTAQKMNKRIMIDLLGVSSSHRVEELVKLGVNLVCLHVGKDMQKEGEFASRELFRLIERIEGIEIAIAGGITEASARELKNSPVDIVIVGSAITGSMNPKEASERISQIFS